MASENNISEKSIQSFRLLGDIESLESFGNFFLGGSTNLGEKVNRWFLPNFPKVFLKCNKFQK